MRFYEMDFETNITVITAQEYMDEVDYTEDDLKYDWGVVYEHYVRAMVTSENFAWRLFAPIRGDYKNSIKNAIAEVMNEMLDEYAIQMYNRK